MMLESRTVSSVWTDAIRFQNKFFIIRLSYKMNKIIYQGWPTLGSRAACVAWFHAALFHKSYFFYQQPGSSQNLPVALLVL